MRGDRDDHVRRNATNETILLIFQAIDSNDDGKISTEEFQAYFESFGINDLNYIKDTFKIFDTNHDQFISQQGKLIFFLFLILNYYKKLITIEFIDVGREYFFGLNNESMTRLFFGPLV